MSRFTVTNLPLEGLKRITRQRLGDARGFLTRLFCAEELAVAGWQKPIAQINHTHTAQRGMVRGMHFQYPPYAEMKLVICIHGAVWDVAVDVRMDSPTFLCWHAEELSADNCCAMIIPEGFAHGFQVLTDNAELIYHHSAFYSPEHEHGLRFDDPALGIRWPLPVSVISPKDQSYPLIVSNFKGIEI